MTTKLGTPRKVIPSEHEEQAAYFTWLQAQHPRVFRLAYANWNEGISGSKARGARYGAKRKRAGLKKGVPDLFIALPVGGKHGLYIEFKRQNMVPSDIKPEQQEWADALVAQGYSHAFCAGFPSAKTATEAYLLDDSP